MREKLVRTYNEIQQIYVRGIDAKHMAIALELMEQVIKEADQIEIDKKEEPNEIPDAE